MKPFIIALLVLLGSVGCAYRGSSNFWVDSTPRGARIEVNGIHVGFTPQNIHLACSRQEYQHDPFADPKRVKFRSTMYTVTVFPAEGERAGLFSQSKEINACMLQSRDYANIFFDLNLEQVAPKQRMELKIK